MSSTYSNVRPSVGTADTVPLRICFSCDDKFAPHLGIVLMSILSSRAPDDRFSFYILDGGISEKNRQKLLSLKSIADFEIQFLTVDEVLFADFPLTFSCWPRIVYYRLLIADLLPDMDRIIYLDCDIIVRGSLSPLQNLDLTGIAFAGVPDTGEEMLIQRLRPFGFDLSIYCNSGVLVINLAELRKRGGFGFFSDFIQKNRDALRYPDQDVLNISLQNQIKILGPEWNTQTLEMSWSQKAEAERLVETATVVHFSGPKPWIPGNRSPIRRLYHDFWKSSPWRDNYRRYCWLVIFYTPFAFFKIFLKWVLHIRWSRHRKYIVLFGQTLYEYPPSDTPQ